MNRQLAERLEGPWVTYWQERLRGSHGGIPPNFRYLRNLMNFVLQNWSQFKGTNIMGIHATRLGWGVRANEHRLYLSLEIVNPSFTGDVVRLASDSFTGFWQWLFVRQRNSFRVLCVNGYQMETILRIDGLSGSGSGSAPINALNQAHWRAQFQAARQYYAGYLSLWVIFRDSLEYVDRDRLKSLSICYRQHWAREEQVGATIRLVSSNPLFRQAGLRTTRALGGAGDLSMLEPGTNCLL